jgi:hypothetical protein
MGITGASDTELPVMSAARRAPDRVWRCRASRARFSFYFGQAVAVSRDEDESVVKIRVAADYSAFPIWPESANARRLRLPQDLHLSPGLVDDLWAWAAVHDRARNPGWNFEWSESVARERDWIEQGRTLAALVQGELGDGYEVVYPYE